jgi:hypothetical protein
MKIPKKYTNSSPSQVSKMKKEIKKFKGKKKGEGDNPFFQWSGDTAPNGRPYKTKPGKATLAYQKKYGKKDK